MGFSALGNIHSVVTCKRNMEKTEGKMEVMHKKITAEPV